MSSSSDHNLKSQLSDLQKRLSQSTLNSPKRPSPRKELNDQHDRVEEGSDSKAPKKSLSNFLTKKEKRVSLPSFDNSKSLSTPTKNNGKDMDFVVGLSENLLLECRKLQAENQTKSNKLKSLEEEFERIKKSNGALMAKLSENAQNEEKFKDSNWELELKLQQLSQDFKTVTDNYNKTQAELNKQLEISHDIRSELDEINMNKDTLEREYSTNKVSNTNQIQDLKSHIDELNDENYKLNDEIEELRRQLDESTKKPVEPKLSSIPILKPTEDESSDEEYKEPPISPVKTIPINNTALESETLRGSLSQAHHTIAKLRAQILKLRSNELSNKQSSPAVSKKTSQTPILKKSLRNLNEPGNRSFHVLKPSSNRSSKNVYEDSMDTSDFDEDWENFEGDTTSSQFIGNESSPSKRSRPISTSQDLIEDTESEIDESELLAPLSSELKTLTDEDVRSYANQHDLVLIPSDEYNKLSKRGSNDDAIITPARDFGFVSLPNDNEDTKETFKESEFYTFANERNLIVLTKDEAAAQEKELADKSQQIVQLESTVSDAEKARIQYVEEADHYRKQLEDALARVKKGTDESKSLQDQLSNPSKDFVHEKASSHGLHVLPIVEHEELQSQLSHFKASYEDPSHDFLHEKALSKNMKLVDDKDHSNLLSQLDALKQNLESKEKEIYELSGRLSEQSKSAKEKEDQAIETIKELKAKIQTTENDNELYKSKVDELSTSVASLKEQLAQPSIAFLTEKAGAHDYKVIHSKDHERQIADFNESFTALQSTIDELKTKLEAVESDLQDKSSQVQELTSKSNDLQKSIDEPSDAYINEKASTKGFKVLEVAIYEKELAELNTTIVSLRDELKTQKDGAEKKSEISNKLIQELKAKVDDLHAERSELNKNIDDFKQQLEHANGNLSILKSQVDNPTHEYLSEKSSKQGLTVLPKLAHVSLLDRANKSIHDLAKEENAVVLKEDEHRELTSKAHEPTLEHVTTKAELHKHKVIPAEEYDDLFKKANTPIEEAATAKGLVLMSNDDHADIQSRLQSPTLDSLHSHLQSHQHVAIPQDDHKSLVEKANKSIETQAKEKNLVLLPKDDHDVLVRKAEQPSLDELKEFAASQSHVVITNADHEALVTHSKKSIKELAEEENHVVLSKDDHAELHRKANNPTVDELVAGCATAGYVASHKDDHAELKKNADRSVHDLAKEQNFVVLHPDEHKKLVTSLESPSIEYLSSKSEAAGHKIVKIDEHDDLVERANKTIDEHAKELSLNVLSEAELDALVNPSEEALSKNAKKLGLVAITKADHEKLVTESKAPTLEHITEKAKVLGYDVVDSNDYQSLVKSSESPSKEFVRAKAAKLGLIAVPEVDYSNLKEEAAKLKKDFADKSLLVEKVSSDGSVVLKKEDYDTLVNKANTSVEDLASSEGKVVLTKEDYDVLLEPSKDSVIDHAAKHDLVAIPKDAHHTLLRNHESPSLDHLSSKASVHGHVVVPKDHYDEIKGLVESPSSSFLSEKARDINSIMIPVDVHEALKVKANRTIDDLAKQDNKVVIDEHHYESLQNPSIEKIKDHADRAGLVATAKDDHEETQKTLNEPPLTFLQDKAKSHSHVLIHQDNLKDLEDHKENPSTDFLSTKAASQGMVVVSKAEFDRLKEFSQKSVETIASEKNLVALPSDEFKALENPSIEILNTKATDAGMVLIKAKDYEQLVHPSKDDLTKSAAEKDLTILSNKSFEDLKLKSEKTIESLAEESGKIVLTSEEHKKLEHPSKERIVSLASEMTMVALAQEDYQKLIHPSAEFLKEHSDNLGLVLVPKEELLAIKEKSSKTIEDLAKESNSVVLTKDQHSALKNPSQESIVEHAAKFGLITLSTDNHSTLLHPSKEVLSVHADREGLKLVPIEEFKTLANPTKDIIKEKALENGLVAIEKSEYDDLHSSAHSPTADHITQKAAAIGYTVISASEHEHLSRSVSNPTREFIESGATKHQLITIDEAKKDDFVEDHLKKNNRVALTNDELSKLRDINTVEFSEISGRLQELGYVAVDKPTYEKLTSDLSKAEIISLAEALGMTAIPTTQYEKLSSGPTEEELKGIAESYNMVLISRPDLDLLKAQAEQPDKKLVESHAATFGCSLVTNKEYESLKNSLSNMSKPDLEAKAEKINHVVIPKEEYEEYVRVDQERSLDEPSTPVSKVAANKDYFENIHKSAEKESQKVKVFESARSLGFVPVAADEYKHLIEHQKDHVLTKSDIYKGAKDFNLAILPVDEYKGLLKNRSNRDDLTYDDLEALAKRFNFKLTKPTEGVSSSRSINPLTLHNNESMATFSSTANESEFADALDRVPSNASTIRDNSTVTEDELRVQAMRLGFTLTPLSAGPNVSEDVPHLENDDDSVADDEDDQYDTIIERSHVAGEPFDRDQLSLRAGELGLIVLEEQEYETLQNRELTKNEFMAKADDFGLKVMDGDEFATLESFKSPSESYIRDISKAAGLVTLSEPEIKEIEDRAVAAISPTDLITEANVREYANNLGLILLSRDRFDELVESAKITKDMIVDKAGDFNLVAVDVDEFNALKTKVTGGTGLSKEAILAGASALGLSVLSSQDLGSREPKPASPTKESLTSDADALGLKVIGENEYKEVLAKSNKSIEDDDVKHYASENNLVIIPTEDYENLKHASFKLSKETVEQRCQELGLVTLPVAEYKKITSSPNSNASPLLSKSDVVQKATEFDLVAVSKEEIDILRNKAADRNKEELTKPKAQPTVLSREEIEAGARVHGLLAIPENSFIATNISRIPDVNNVVVLPVTYYNKLTKSEQLNLDKISNDELQAQARKRGFHVTYGEVDFNRDIPPLTRKNTITSLTSSNSRRNLAEAAASAAYQEYENQPKTMSRSSSRARSISRSGSAANIHQRDVSIDGGISLMTDASLSEPNIIPALTQTVIGEYLYKYYRRLGPLSSISESRHERYFWIHPYTLTLYWSSTNPVLGNPSTHKTRAAAIIGVESIDDNNPLPAGLYHKSIIVHSQTRSIKITCPTRQRHNIWYNSLRYLIQRSMDGINLEEDLDLLKDNATRHV